MSGLPGLSEPFRVFLILWSPKLYTENNRMELGVDIAGLVFDQIEDRWNAGQRRCGPSNCTCDGDE